MKVVIVVPAHNEEEIIAKSVERIVSFMARQHGYSWRVVVAENGSKDGTLEILRGLLAKYPKDIFSVKSLAFRSKSDAIKTAWLSEDADVYVHMDADLSTDIRHIPELLNGIREGYDLVIGSRPSAGAGNKRSLRNFTSSGYNLLARMLFSVKVGDLQCGFKAVNRRTLEAIVKKTRYLSEGFMDTEILILAAQKNITVKEIPVRWREYRGSRFNRLLITIRFIGNMVRVKRDLMLGRYN